jgi:membrane protease YdiL (CAAX protease family)
MQTPSPPTLRSALVGLALVFVVAYLARGFPGLQDPERARPFEGLGAAIDARLEGGGRVRHERVRRAHGRETLVEASASVGAEVASVALHALGLVAACAFLRRRGARLLPDREELDRALDVLAWLAPLLVGGALVAGLLLARGDGRGLERAVDGLLQPLLAHPATAWLLLLRLVVLAPLVEEAVWRGVVYPGLRARLPVGPASVATAFLFGLWHALAGWDQPLALALQYGFALLACALVERRPDRLGAPVLLHALGNLAAVGLFGVCLWAPEALLALFGV